MAIIIDLNKIDSINRQYKKIVLVGGCFDIFHIGHLRFLEKAKKAGDILIVALESDRNIKRLKGNSKPIHSQQERADILGSIEFIDYIILLPDLGSDAEYFALVKNIKPDVIAATDGDPIMMKKKKQAEMVGGKLVVISKLNIPSTSQLAKLLEVD